MRSLKWIIISAVLLILAAIFIFVTFQRQYRDVFAEVVIFPWGVCGDNSLTYRFIITNDGAFISYIGIARNHCDITRNDLMRPTRLRRFNCMTTRHFMGLFRERAVTTLSDEDFQTISNVIELSVEDYYTYEGDVGFRSQWTIILLYQGYAYWWMGLDLMDEIVRLSPLTLR